MKAGKVWLLTTGGDNPMTIAFQSFGNTHIQLYSPSAPMTVESISFTAPDHIVVVTKENGREIWNTLRSKGWVTV